MSAPFPPPSEPVERRTTTPAIGDTGKPGRGALGAIREAVAKYRQCMDIALGPVGHPDEHERDLHGAYAGHYAAIAVLLHHLHQAAPEAADRTAAWLERQDTESIHYWIADLEVPHG